MDVIFCEVDREYYGSPVKHIDTNTHGFSDCFKDTEKGLMRSKRDSKMIFSDTVFFKTNHLSCVNKQEVSIVEP